MSANIPIVQEYMNMPEQELVVEYRLLVHKQKVMNSRWFAYVDGDELNRIDIKIGYAQAVAKERGIELGG